jgi:hypothetical protein
MSTRWKVIIAEDAVTRPITADGVIACRADMG